MISRVIKASSFAQIDLTFKVKFPGRFLGTVIQWVQALLTNRCITSLFYPPVAQSWPRTAKRLIEKYIYFQHSAQTKFAAEIQKRITGFVGQMFNAF